MNAPFIKFIVLFCVTFFIASCHKDSKLPLPQAKCIELIAPTGNNISPYNVTFKWTSCSADSSQLFLIADGKLVDSAKTIAKEYTFNFLNPATDYQWFVTNGKNVSDTIAFESSYPDSMVIGYYDVIVSYFVAASGAPTIDTIYGLRRIEITSTNNGPGGLSFSSDSFPGGTIQADYSPTYSRMYNCLFYGPLHGVIQYFPINDSINIENTSIIEQDYMKIHWKGHKVK